MGSLGLVADHTGGDRSRADRSISSIESVIDMANPLDPDLQNTVSEFSSFTEHLPADMQRSTSLIRVCEDNYLTAASDAKRLARNIQMIPNSLDGAREDINQVHAKLWEISNEIMSSRELAKAESVRQLEILIQHLKRAQVVRKKFIQRRENYPESREGTPVARQSTSPQATRLKIQLTVDSARGETDQSGHRLHRRPIQRIIVPGEVLNPNEVDYEEYYGSSSDESASDDLSTPRQTPGRTLGGTTRISIKVPKRPKSQGPKPPRAPRPPGSVGTNVHSSVAGISTSNALAKLKPPPEDAVIGDEHLPWMRLTQYELAKLRKRMKKNAVWNPSQTMINRELKELGRSKEEFEAAKKIAIEKGLPLPKILPPSAAELAEIAALPGAIDGTVGTAITDGDPAQEVQFTNKGMELNRKKKEKKEAQAKEEAAQMEQAARKTQDLSDVVQMMRGLVGNMTTPSKSLPKTSPAKRKRIPTPDEAATPETSKANDDKNDGKISTPAIRPHKRPKTETPIPPPKSSVSINAAALLARSRATTELSPAADSIVDSTISTTTTTTLVPLKGSSPPKKSATPILPPAKDKKSLTLTPKTTNVTTRATTPSHPMTRGQISAASTPAPDAPTTTTRRSSSRGKATSVEPAQPSGAKDRARRASTAHSTPGPEGPPRPPSRQNRRKRPAPGPVTSAAEGLTVSKGKRSAAPRKKAGPKKPKDGEKDAPEIWDEVDDEGNEIDPNEPRYCLCNRVSFGDMVKCENANCEYQWFHFGCVGLTGAPGRTTKWYCPECREKGKR